MAGIISCCLLLINRTRSAWYRADGMEGMEIYCRYRGERDASPNGLSFITVRAAQRSAVKGVRACVQHNQHTLWTSILLCPSYFPVQYSRDERLPGSAERGGS